MIRWIGEDRVINFLGDLVLSDTRFWRLIGLGRWFLGGELGYLLECGRRGVDMIVV